MVQTRYAIIVCLLCSLVSYFAGSRGSGAVVDGDRGRIAQLVEVSEKQAEQVATLMRMNKELAESLVRSRKTIDLANEQIAVLESELQSVRSEFEQFVFDSKIREIDAELQIKNLQTSVNYLETKKDILADSVEFYRSDRDRLLANVSSMVGGG